MKQIAAVYARVSTLQQEQEATIESQVAAIESYAQAQGYQLLPEYYFLDQAVSGAQLARPGLDRLRDLAAEGIFEAMLPEPGSACPAVCPSVGIDGRVAACRSGSQVCRPAASGRRPARPTAIGDPGAVCRV